MEFWGIEIKPGKPFKVEPEDGYTIHVSQIVLGDVKNVKDENVPVYVKNGDDKNNLLIGILSQNIPQCLVDLYFEQEFELSHNSKTSVFLLGYKVLDVSDEEDEEIDSDEVDEFLKQQADGLPSNGMMNGEMIKPEEDESGSDKEDDESDSDEGEDEDESEGEEEEEEEPIKVEPPSKKRPNSEAMNNKVASKKAKVAIQNKSSGGKKKCPFPCGSSCKN